MTKSGMSNLPFTIYPSGENCRQLLHTRCLLLNPIFGHLCLWSISPTCQSSLYKQFLLLDPISGHWRLLFFNLPSKLCQSSLEVKKVAVICLAVVGFSRYGSLSYFVCEYLVFIFIFFIKNSTLSLFFLLGFTDFIKASLKSEKLQLIFIFAAVGVSQSNQKVRIDQPWPE